MIKLPTTIRYGTRLLAVLAREDKKLTTVQLAKKMDISPLYLRQVALPLEKLGYIKSIRGAGGGYLLGRKAEEITLLDLFNAFEENVDLIDCIKDSSACTANEKCLTRPYWLTLSKIIKDFLLKTSIKNIIESNDE